MMVSPDLEDYPGERPGTMMSLLSGVILNFSDFCHP